MNISSCPTCGKRVYPAEAMGVSGKTYHARTCILCKTCKRKIPPGHHLDHAGEIYCNGCYNAQFVDEETRKIAFDSQKCARSASTSDANS